MLRRWLIGSTTNITNLKATSFDCNASCSQKIFGQGHRNRRGYGELDVYVGWEPWNADRGDFLESGHSEDQEGYGE